MLLRRPVLLVVFACATLPLWRPVPTPVHGAQVRDQRTEEFIARGLRHIRLLRGSPSSITRHRVVVGSYDSQAQADAMLARLVEAGFAPAPHYRSGRYRISVDALPSEEAAQTIQQSLEAAGFSSELNIEVYNQDETHPQGPWEIHVLEASPEAVRVEVAHAYDAAIGLETTSGLARRRGATAAVNGGYYLRTGILQGDAVGVLQLNGTLVSEPDRGRAALGIIETDDKTEFLFGRLRFQGEIRFADGTRAPLDGVNRRRATGEIVLYTPEFHRTTLTPPGGVEVTVVDNRILEVRDGPGSAVIPSDGLVVSFSESAATELRSHLRVGAEVVPTLSLLPVDTTDSDSTPRWGEAASIVGGGPLLLDKGKRVEDPKLESISRVFFLARHPRTGIGVREDGTLLFVTVDGRQPMKSVGMSLPELTDLFVELGAVSAVNLDGGGSTAMVIHDRVVNLPSDPSGERPSADAILIFARAPSS